MDHDGSVLCSKDPAACPYINPAVIHFLYTEHVQGAEICQMLSAR